MYCSGGVPSGDPTSGVGMNGSRAPRSASCQASSANWAGPPNDDVMWRVTDGGWLYVIRDATQAGRSLVTISVTNLDEAVAELAQRNITVGPVAPVGDAGRKAKGEDPDGNSIDLIEVNP
jgi:hypothetical protein